MGQSFILTTSFESAIIKQVVLNKSSLLLKIQKENSQALQLFTAIIKWESIFKSN
jgi:hypothetical protein